MAGGGRSGGEAPLEKRDRLGVAPLIEEERAELLEEFLRRQLEAEAIWGQRLGTLVGEDRFVGIAPVGLNRAEQDVAPGPLPGQGSEPLGALQGLREEPEARPAGGQLVEGIGVGRAQPHALLEERGGARPLAANHVGPGPGPQFVDRGGPDAFVDLDRLVSTAQLGERPGPIGLGPLGAGMEIEVVLGQRQGPRGLTPGEGRLGVAERALLPPLPGDHAPQGGGDRDDERQELPQGRAEKRDSGDAGRLGGRRRRMGHGRKVVEVGRAGGGESGRPSHHRIPPALLPSRRLASSWLTGEEWCVRGSPPPEHGSSRPPRG